MIIILDDSFTDRHKFNDIEYLKQVRYSNVCKVYSAIKTTEINKLFTAGVEINFLGFHKSLQLYNNEDTPLGIEENTKYREVLLNKVSELNIQKVEFSGGLETNYDSKKIDKELFYRNLKGFIDYFIEYQEIEPKILFWGLEFKMLEEMAIIQKGLIQVRVSQIENFKNNLYIMNALNLVYGENKSEVVVDEWIMDNLSKNDIIRLINNKILN